ncbi:hypothetical protein ACFL2H_08160 [Planctomycetota bacterium]
MNKHERRTLARNIVFQRTNLSRLAGGGFRKYVLPYSWRVRLDSLIYCDAIISEYKKEMQSEWDRLKPFAPPRASRIMDIGCGVGGVHIFMDEIVHDSDASIFLVDRNHESRKIHYGFQSEASAYNSLDLTKRFLVDHGIPTDRIRLLDIDVDSLPVVAFDFIFSLISWGFHYPVDTYLEYAKTALKDDGVMILDCRHGTKGAERLSEFFKVEQVDESKTSMRVRCTR